MLVSELTRSDSFYDFARNKDLIPIGTPRVFELLVDGRGVPIA